MANEAVTAAVAANRDVSGDKPGPFQDCSDVLHIAVFFDGTGNNKDVDEPLKRWSNVARMHRAAQITALADKSKSTYPIYISGVGTPYNGTATGWQEDAKSWIQDNDVTGMGVGLGGDRRLDLGDDTVNEKLRDVLIANAKKLGGKVATYAETSSTKSFAEVNAALGKHRLIKMINISFFGFSRGAALARAFSNRVIKGCKANGDQLEYQGYPVRFNFMGVFDTVASFGVPAKNATLPWQERDLIVSPKIERCVHLISAHEVRFAFPVDLIRKNGKLAGNWVEKTYPGVHTDVGGGYAPFDQEINNNAARIPMREMMSESLANGVRMIGYNTLAKDKDSAAIFKERFECTPETDASYKDYMAVCGELSGTIESQMKQHMKMLFSAYGTMHRLGMSTAGDRSRQESTLKYKYLFSKGMAYEVEMYRAAVGMGKWVRIANPQRGYVQYVKPEDWQIAAWDAKASAKVVNFVANFIHDSKVDFLGNVEPFSYFKPRGVAESTISVWREGGNWISEKADAVGDAAAAGYKATEKQVVKAADYTQKKVTEGADYTERKGKEAIAAAKRKEQEAEEFAKRKYKQGEKYVTKKADQIEREAERLYDKGSHWVKSTKDEIVKETNEAATAAKKQANIAYDESAKVLDKAGNEIKKESNELYSAAKKFLGF